MVEMKETAAMLKESSGQSLVILDEVGRGTSTYDGMSLAQSILEYLVSQRHSMTLFATHYHELTALSEKLPTLSNHSMKVREWQGDVIFLHEVGSGSADRSYGIQVAKLAGLPKAVIVRAESVLTYLQEKDQGKGARKLVDDLPLFANVVEKLTPEEIQKAPSVVEDKLAASSVDDLSPREALALLYELKDMIEEVN